jgi:hypothetical protein
VLASIHGASHWVILAKDIERFRRDLPILPLNKNVVSRTLVFWIGSPIDRISGVILGSMSALWLKHVTLSLKTP